MHITREIAPGLVWIGASERRLSLFENNFPIPRGVSYNAYLITDEKTALLDTADSAVGALFFENLEHALGGRPLDYFVIHHMEPDHAAQAAEIQRRYPGVKVVGNAKTFAFLEQFHGPCPVESAIVVKEGDTLSLGERTLTFVMAPMVHWPEAMVSYEASTKTLFSADAFGTFGALDGAIFADEVDFPGEWLDDARRYYTNICGKYGPQVQALLKKAAGLDIATICPLHGPVWRRDLGWYIGYYDKWSRYEPECRAVSIFCGSMYGGTERAAEALAAMLSERGVRVRLFDIASTHSSALIAEAFRVSHLVFAAPTYNNGLYPGMVSLLHDLKEHQVQGRGVAVIENGSWAPQAGKIMRAALEEMKDMELLCEPLTVRSRLKEAQLGELSAMADALAKSAGTLQNL